MVFSLGGSSGSSRSSSESQNFNYGYNYGQTYLDPNQAAAQQQLQGQFFNQAPTMGNVPGFGYMQNNAMQGIQGVANRSMGYGQQLRQQGNQGRMLMNQFAQQGNPFLQNQIANLAQGYGQLFNEQILPGIGGDAALAGARGSSRQGIAEALGAQRVGQEFFGAAGNLAANAYALQQQAADRLMTTGQQGAQNMYAQAAQARGLQSQMGIGGGQFALQQQAMPFQIGAQVVGAPSVLSTTQAENVSYGYSKSKGKSSNQSIGIGLG